jgi:hypothetical protein
MNERRYAVVAVLIVITALAVVPVIYLGGRPP